MTSLRGLGAEFHQDAASLPLEGKRVSFGLDLAIAERGSFARQRIEVLHLAADVKDIAPIVEAPSGDASVLQGGVEIERGIFCGGSNAGAAGNARKGTETEEFETFHQGGGIGSDAEEASELRG